MKTYPMSAADASWFHNDGPANLADIMLKYGDVEPVEHVAAQLEALQR